METGLHRPLGGYLPLGTLAKAQDLSPSYLSTVFHRKKSKTLSDFVRSRRMEHAAYLLSSTDIQIQTVALHCCIMDMQYFSMLFKGYHSVTPTAYRATRKRERRS